MGQVDALKMVENVRRRLVDLAVAENFIRDDQLLSMCRAIWNNHGQVGGLVSELWVEGSLPGEKTQDTLRSLSQEGLIPETLRAQIAHSGVFQEDRQLYNHQSEAIRLARHSNHSVRPTLVITAGTGMGKTEAFLLPMLADLWNAPIPRPNGGMRCLILYPMNALIADQVERVYGWLRDRTGSRYFILPAKPPKMRIEQTAWAFSGIRAGCEHDRRPEDERHMMGGSLFRNHGDAFPT